jgi:hypothetical protein
MLPARASTDTSSRMLKFPFEEWKREWEGKK